MSGGEDQARAEARLRRIEERVVDLDRITDPIAREHARELFEALIELHGLAIARMMAKAAKVPGGAALVDGLGRDAQVRPVLLLHGLHPDDLQTRVRAAIAGLRADGMAVSLVRIVGRSAVVRAAGEGDRERIEMALYEAAPDLDGIELLAAQRHEPAAAAAPAEAVR